MRDSEATATDWPANPLRLSSSGLGAGAVPLTTALMKRTPCCLQLLTMGYSQQTGIRGFGGLFSGHRKLPICSSLEITICTDNRDILPICPGLHAKPLRYPIFSAAHFSQLPWLSAWFPDQQHQHPPRACYMLAHTNKYSPTVNQRETPMSQNNNALIQRLKTYFARIPNL